MKSEKTVLFAAGICVTLALLLFWIFGCSGVGVMASSTDDMQDAVDRHKPEPDSTQSAKPYFPPSPEPPIMNENNWRVK